MQKYEATVATGPTIVPKKLDGTGKKEVCTRREDGGERKEKGGGKWRKGGGRKGWKEEGRVLSMILKSRASPEATCPINAYREEGGGRRKEEAEGSSTVEGGRRR
jgi:hypothetical protein